MGNFDELAKRLKGLNEPLSNNLLFGLVTSVNPIKIKIEGYPELKDNQLILSNNVKEIKIKIPHHKHIDNQVINFDHEILIQRGLKANDKVLVLQSNNKQIFYILEILNK